MFPKFLRYKVENDKEKPVDPTWDMVWVDQNGTILQKINLLWLRSIPPIPPIGASIIKNDFKGIVTKVLVDYRTEDTWTGEAIRITVDTDAV